MFTVTAMVCCFSSNNVILLCMLKSLDGITVTMITLKRCKLLIYADKTVMCVAQIPLVVTLYLAHALWYRKKSWRAILRLSDSTARHAPHEECDRRDTCSRASPQRGLGWTCPLHFFQRLFLRLMQIQSTKDWTCKHEHYCFDVRHVGTSTVRHARVVTCCDVTQQVEFGLLSIKFRFEISSI